MLLLLLLMLLMQVVQLVVAGGSLGQLEVMAAANPYSRQQTTAMEPVRCGNCHIQHDIALLS
jgi:hypothetical protein